MICHKSREQVEENMVEVEICAGEKRNEGLS